MNRTSPIPAAAADRPHVLMTAHNLAAAGPDAKYVAPVLVLLSNGLGAFLGPDDEWAQFVDGVACFSEKHKELLTRVHPKITTEKCFVTGLGVDSDEVDRPLLVVGSRHHVGVLLGLGLARSSHSALDIGIVAARVQGSRCRGPPAASPTSWPR